MSPSLDIWKKKKFTHEATSESLDRQSWHASPEKKIHSWLAVAHVVKNSHNKDYIIRGKMIL